MSDEDQTLATAQLERVNSELSRGLQRCRFLLDDCRAKLAANSNEPHVAQPDRGEDRGQAH